MKFRYYIRGFGAGLIVGVIVLVIAGAIKSNNAMLEEDSTEETQSSGSVIAYTESSGESSSDETASDAENSEDSTQADGDSDAQNESGTDETEATTEATTDEADTQAEVSTETPTIGITVGDGEVEIVFKNVYTAAQAADLLYDAGIIEDKTEFYNYMYITGYDRKMKDGTYYLKAGDSLETIAKTITQTE